MTVFDPIPNTEVDIDKAVKSSTGKKFRDNPEAIMEGDATALAAGKGIFVEKSGQTAIITDETDVEKILTPDGAGGAKWTSGLIGMILVERKEITGAAVNDVTFSDLDGDTDEVYFLLGRIKRQLAATVADFSIQPNALATNQSSRLIVDGTAQTSADLEFADINDTQSGLAFHMWIHARTLFARTFEGQTILANPIAATVPSIQQFGGIWDEEATNITSLKIVSTFPPQINIGSTFELFKLAQV